MASGTLYIVATPIGNLGDITDRARQVLSESDLVLAEDTRNTQKLLDSLNIDVPCTAVHNHNEREKIEWIALKLDEGKKLSLVSDAGTPLISDPGYPIVTQLRDQGYSVIPIPGVSAVTAALSVCGLPTDRFCFEGFLPSKSGARQKKLLDLKDEKRTMVFYEAPHRLLNMVSDVSEIFGVQRKVSLCRELTKTFETIWTGAAGDLVNFVAEDVNQQKGEAVVLISGREEVGKQDDISESDRVLMRLLLAEMPLKKASVVAAKYTGKAKKIFYQWGVENS